MIVFKCPNCGHMSETVSTVITIRAHGKLLVRTDRRGITFHAAGDLRMLDTVLHTGLPTDYVCPNCGESIPAEDWCFTFLCDRCHNEILCPTTDWEDANAFMAAHRCGDGGGIKCYSCWATTDRSYCKTCRIRKTCPGFTHFEEVKKRGGEGKHNKWSVTIEGNRPRVSSEQQAESPPRRTMYNTMERVAQAIGIDTAQGQPLEMPTPVEPMDYDEPE